MRARLLLSLLVAAPTLLSAAVEALAARGPCPQAATARQSGRFVAAEAAARACLERDPRDVGVWFELSRALGYQRQWEEALHWAESGLERYPKDMDLALWRVRLLAWSGELSRARDALAQVFALAPAARGDREAAMLEVDLVWWGRDWRAAAAGFTRYLERWPEDPEAYRKRGISWLESGREARALADFDRSCRLAGQAQPSCRYAEDLRRRSASVEVSLESRYAAAPAGQDEVITRLSAMARVWRALRVGVAGEVRLRDGGGGPAHDTLGYLLATWRSSRWSVEGGVGLGFEPRWSPELTAWLEPAVALWQPLWVHLRYWRLDFGDGGGHVVSPAVNLYAGAWNLEGRYYLGLEEDGATTHAALGRLRWSPSPAWAVEVGGGGGSAADYLVVRDADVQGHQLALAGLRWSPSWRHRVELGYVFRHEGVDGEARTRHELRLGYRLTL